MKHRIHIPLTLLALAAAVLLVRILFCATAAYAVHSVYSTNAAIPGHAARISGSIQSTLPDDEVISLLPRSVTEDEVYLHSEADIATWAYLKVTIPMMDAALEGDREICPQEALTVNVNDNDFVLVAAEEGGKAGGASVCLYRLREALPPKTSTPALYTKIAVPDFCADSGGYVRIRVEGYLIQQAHLTAAEADRLAAQKAGL